MTANNDVITTSQEAEQLISTSKIHPQTIIAGWRTAVDCARQALTDAAKDNSADPEKFKEVCVCVCVCVCVHGWVVE